MWTRMRSTSAIMSRTGLMQRSLSQVSTHSMLCTLDLLPQWEIPNSNYGIYTKTVASLTHLVAE